MVIEISVAVIAFAFAILVGFLVATLCNVIKSLKIIRKDLEQLSPDVRTLIHNAKDLSADLKMKSESLNFLFHPLHALNQYQEGHREHKSSKSQDKAADLMECILSSMALYKKIKGVIKHYVKS